MFDVSRLVIPGITDLSTLTRISRARKYSQFVGMVESPDDCIFCNLPPENVILFTNETFFAWKCRPPEDHTLHHLIFAPRRHVICFEEFTRQEEFDWFEIQRQIKAEYKLTAYGILERDNAVEMAGTIKHQHNHLLTGDGTGRVESPFCKGEQADNESLAKAIVFAKIRQMIIVGQARTPVEAALMLPIEEQKLVEGKLN